MSLKIVVNYKQTHTHAHIYTSPSGDHVTSFIISVGSSFGMTSPNTPICLMFFFLLSLSLSLSAPLPLSWTLFPMVRSPRITFLRQSRGQKPNLVAPQRRISLVYCDLSECVSAAVCLLSQPPFPLGSSRSPRQRRE